MADVIRPWCRSCGHEAATAERICAHCATPMDHPAVRDDRAGSVVRVSRRFMSVTSIVLADAGTSLTVLVPGDSPVEMASAAVDGYKKVDVEHPALRGGAGRLWAAQLAKHNGRLRAKWADQPVEEAAWALATADIGSRRAAVLDALALGRDDLADALGLSVSELAWLRAYMAACTRDTSTLLDALERLPESGYSARVGFLIARAADLTADARLGKRAADQVRPFAERVPDAKALLTVLDPDGITRARDLIGGYATQVAAAVPDAGAAVTTTPAAWISEAEAPPEMPSSGSPPTVRALATYLAGRDGVNVDGGSALLGAVPLVLIDELVDAGTLTAASARQAAWRAEHAAYLRCRLDPADAQASDIAGAGFVAEQARRHYLAGDEDALAGLPDTADVRHFRALAAWRRAGTVPATEREHLRPPVLAVLSEVEELREALKQDGPGTPRGLETLAADPSLWPLFAAEARSGALTLPHADRERFPHFADWLDLHRLVSLIHTHRWRDAAKGGDVLAGRASSGRVRAEAGSLAAFAEAQQGDSGSALRRLDQAITSHRSAGLLVNAVVVARDQGSLAALPYLAQLAAGDDADPALREEAVKVATGQWLADSTSQEYPPALAQMVHAALERPQPDDELRNLLMLSATFDAAWMSKTQSIATGSPGQRVMVDVYRTSARVTTPGYDTSMADFAKVLGGLVAAPPVPAWIEEEFRDFTKMLYDGVHCDFGDAVHLYPPINELLKAGVLNPVQRLVLAVQAGAHLAAHFGKEGSTISAAVEKTLFFDPCSAYLAGAPEDVSEEAREDVGLELARCLLIGAANLLDDTQAAFDAAADRWDQLVRVRSITAPAGQPSFQHMQRKLLDELGAHVTRLRAYEKHVTKLPMEDRMKDLYQQLNKAVSGWSSEITRLRRFV